MSQQFRASAAGELVAAKQALRCRCGSLLCIKNNRVGSGPLGAQPRNPLARARPRRQPAQIQLKKAISRPRPAYCAATNGAHPQARLPQKFKPVSHGCPCQANLPRVASGAQCPRRPAASSRGPGLESSRHPAMQRPQPPGPARSGPPGVAHSRPTRRSRQSPPEGLPAAFLQYAPQAQPKLPSQPGCDPMLRSGRGKSLAIDRNSGHWGGRTRRYRRQGLEDPRPAIPHTAQVESGPDPRRKGGTRSPDDSGKKRLQRMAGICCCVASCTSLGQTQRHCKDSLDCKLELGGLCFQLAPSRAKALDDPAEWRRARIAHTRSAGMGIHRIAGPAADLPDQGRAPSARTGVRNAALLSRPLIPAGCVGAWKSQITPVVKRQGLRSHTKPG